MMDQEIVHHARLAFLMLAEQTRPDAEPDADKVVKALTKLVAFGEALDAEGLSTDAAIELMRSAFFGASQVKS